MAVHVVNEARRCLNCKIPQCRKGCPIQTPIPDMIRLFLDNQLEHAGQMLFENNPLSVVCSLVCDHEKQCEGHCVLGRKGEPVHISSIENYISDSCLDRLCLQRDKNKNKRVAIIGSGPAGITISVLLAEKGYDVQFGARPLKRAIQTHLEDGLSELIITSSLKEKDIIQVSLNKEKGELEMKVIAS